MKALTNSSFNFTGQKSVYNGKVRDVYHLNDRRLVMVASDRISAFDHVLPKGIPYKGQVLNQVATMFLKATEDIVPNWLEATPDANVAVGMACEPIRVEMVIRGYLAGHAAREYNSGKRVICGVSLPDGLNENDKLPKPIITPATKAEKGHDEDISREEIINKKIVSEEDYILIEKYTHQLYLRGSELAEKQNLILVDTKYEFGKTNNGEIILIDEIHTPDSSRYFYKNGYKQRQLNREPQKQLSKEFVRQWLISKGFQGLDGQKPPEMTDDFVNTISERYIELYEKIMGEKFQKENIDNISERISKNLSNYL
jgi:phosphoribosylaminoimidazole-succinocarboxamide synthase